MKLVWNAVQAALLSALTIVGSALAAQVEQFTPQGTVAQLNQVKVRFSEPMIAFGDNAAAAPFDINCSATGSGRWLDERNWVYEFSRAPQSGKPCSFQLSSALKTRAGNALEGQRRFVFQAAAARVERIEPYADAEIEEEQAFILFFSAPVDEASLRARAYCEIAGIHERVPVKLVSGAARTALLNEFAKEIKPASVATLQCQQSFPADVAVRLVWQGEASKDKAAQADQRFPYKVRSPFSAKFSCQRENANAACTPVLPLHLLFSTEIPRAIAEKIVLRAGDRQIKPFFYDNERVAWVSRLTFKTPLPANASVRLELPTGIKDQSGRPLSNAAQFPLTVAMADYPPLAKFPASPFGIIELNGGASLPLSLRNVEPELLMRSADGRIAPGQLSKLKVDDDGAIIAWISKLNRYHERTLRLQGRDVETRSLGLLAQESSARTLKLPSYAAQASRPFEVIGIPFDAPGFYVLELASPSLGAALLAKPAPMFVRTSALVTNLAVHLKLARETGMVWVTRLDNAKPVADAAVQLSDCRGNLLWKGRSDSRGIAMLPAGLVGGCAAADGKPDSVQIPGYFVSARKRDELGRDDVAFALSSWNNGIESFRFNLPTEQMPAATLRAHTVLDRNLLRAGETVSMKHMIRSESSRGFEFVAANKLPTRLRIIHQGSNQEFQFPLTWRAGNLAESSFAIRAQAKLGRYEIVLDRDPASAGASSADNGGSYMTGAFRVEELRLPLLQGRIVPPAGALIAPASLPLNVQLNYLNGGGAAGLPVQITAMLRERNVHFPEYENFSFSVFDAAEEQQKIIADKISVTLDNNGAGKTVLQALPALTRAKEVQTEMTYADPNGEIQTVSALTPLWPAAVVVGIKTEAWIAVKRQARFSALALDTAGRPQAGVAMTVAGTLKRSNSHRKRLVGGFYAYENVASSESLGTLCSGKTDQRGLLLCDIALKQSGNIELLASAKDAQGRISTAQASFWASSGDEIWFDGENQDRIDVIPEKKSYQAGETASFQVRMPFRAATALVAVEREGVIDTMVLELTGRDPTVRVPIKASYGPNVFVSVLAVRARLREVPWYSFFKWGWKEPLNWWQEYREYQAPTATVDLAKPAFKFGIAEIRVGTAAHALAVQVKADRATYPIRAKAQVTVSVKLPDGKAAAGAEVAIAAVDEALLELQPNESWDVLAAMMQRRSYGVETATAQMQVIGKRHYGRKAVAAGGGGGTAPTRELLDTLLLWQASVRLDANGQARIEVPLNDALSSFRIVAVATSGAALFGSGSTSIRATQDLQIVSGLPPMVREGDQYSAMFTLRNTSARAMSVTLQARTDSAALTPQQVALAAGASKEVAWQVSAPALSGSQESVALAWRIEAKEQGGSAADALQLDQQLLPAVMLSVRQASLQQIDQTWSLAVRQPEGSLPLRGGIAVSLSPSLSNGSAALKRYFTQYPYTCLEQQASRAIGLRDPVLWQKFSAALPAYLDGDGLAYFYPPNDPAQRQGSDSLSAYLLSVSDESGYSLPSAAKEKMLDGLSAFVDGKITRDFWAPRKDLEVRKLAALEALSRYRPISARQLGSVQVTPALWPTSALLDWLALLQRVPTLPQRDGALKEALQQLRNRLDYQGTRIGWSSESSDYWWWLMSNADVNSNRLVLLALNEPSWRDELPKIFSGALQRQVNGQWLTTTANVWGLLAMEKFSKKFEANKVSGTSRITLRSGIEKASPALNVNWASATPTAGLLAWPPQPGSDDRLQVQHDGAGKPWLSLQSLAAQPLRAPVSAGYRLVKTVTPLTQKIPGRYSRGDTLRVVLAIEAQSDMSAVVVSDPIPAGATVLGSGLGRDSALAERQTRPPEQLWPSFEERSFSAFRSYYQFIPKGKFTMSYTMRLNNAGRFHLPASRVEAMYAPEMFAELPNALLQVE
ncbi:MULTISPECIES: alpha-2-macroglobulin family protein [unclassified Undibacterium]|uniref:alpha-2-macroglobulin family protein n=1 Tax=unclassified Undibacterium TaxID=2630295 RepID=UPI002AC8B564|nr:MULTISPECIES: MG2 domain-containing protein [unclassified Undibacterium]MEB0140237.1 MG2 domain-containing protein [Undibacterium sp. CCC2.1]MEB0173268.1 MG2 domain-containing protein [Undibacterium sp. CCC1.1]MEB0177109.1 MG2 domain-containing protein [Undibacterium sp. CCC3.4]MEB0216376.1 MG2 domain-containing protein [Undibacterium sp. 5I2]WPX42987.1 MG2 domain-containing protein [Undibacterium sp. CCC3.4]